MFTLAIGIRTVFVLTGLFIIVSAFLIYTLHRLILKIAMYWNLFGVVLIVLGLLPIWKDWMSAIPLSSYAVFVFIGYLMILGLFYLSSRISRNIIQTREMAMHIALLNQENEEILEHLVGEEEAKLRIVLDVERS